MSPGWKILCDLPSCIRSSNLVWLVGFSWIPHTIVSGVRCIHIDGKGEPDYNSEADELRSILPGGLEVTGVLLVSDRSEPAEAFRILKKLCQALKNTPEVLVAATASSQRGNISFYDQKLELLECETSSESFWHATRVLHSQVPLDLVFYTSPKRDYEKQLSTRIEEIINSFTDENIVFILEDPTKKILLQSQTEELAEIFPLRLSDSIPHPVSVRVLTKQSSNLEKVSSPVIQYTPSAEGTLLHHIKISLDVLCLVPSNCVVAKTKQHIIHTLSVQLQVMKVFLSEKNAQQLHPYHFNLPGFLHPVTAIYDLAKLESDPQAVDVRKTLHSRLGLPLDRPLLRIANALTIRGPELVTQNSNGGKRLLNVHAGLPRCGISGGQLSLIDGSYEYYHYLQDRCDDKGWGCAYRSLQTIISWFRLQHYTSVDVPSHREIQETLVDIGDKEPSFIGSKEWIGAIELSFVLDKLLGVTSKILNVRSGAELPEKCRELAAHFDTQGTPVMIGGGVLAYTLLGVDYNELTGDCAFLILDPHYTGGEELKSIRSGGWCGWKRAVSESGQEFFLRNKFYNLLLPQRPEMI